MSLRILARLGAVPAVLGIAVLGIAAPAAAHVTITPSTTAAGAFAVLTVSVPHGCDGSSTTEIAIEIPDEINAVTPTRNPLWEVEKEVQQLDPPVTDAHGNETTERVATVTYTADEPLPEGYRDSFELSLQVPDAEGTSLVFPIVQTCEEGESAWIEVPAEGQSPDELELPAPGFTITAAGEDGHDAAPEAEESDGADESDGAEEAVDANTAGGDEAPDSDDGEALSAWALGAGILGVLLGGVALVQGRRRA